MHILKTGISNSYFEKVTFNIKPEVEPTPSIFQTDF